MPTALHRKTLIDTYLAKLGVAGEEEVVVPLNVLSRVNQTLLLVLVTRLHENGALADSDLVAITAALETLPTP